MTQAQNDDDIRLRALRKKRVSYILVFLVAFFALKQSRSVTELEKILKSGELVMLSQNGPTNFYEGPDGMVGFEYELGKAFASHLGVQLVLQNESDLGLLLGALDDRQVDFAAATLTKTEPRSYFVDFGPSYGSVSQKVIYRAGTTRPRKVEDLIGGDLVVIDDSSHEQRLVQEQSKFPDLSWQVVGDAEMSDLIEAVHKGDIEYAIVDSIAIELLRGLYPKARIGFSISEEQPLAWAFPKRSDKSVIKRAEHFFSLESTKTLITEIREKYFGHSEKLNFGGSVLFAKRLQSRLPKWRDLLQKAAAETDQDWRLLAAISYQESHWNPKAVSPTGVRGFMMLTQAAAKDVGVEKRYVADQSIFGGARYFKKMYERIPDNISDPDRLWLALAAYNIGFGHLQDARKLAEQAGQNPDKWVQVKPHLLSLSKRKHYKQTRHGYARGWEAVDYVENIRNFYRIIGWHEADRQEALLTQREELAQEEQGYDELSPVVTDALQTLTKDPASAEL